MLVADIVAIDGTGGARVFVSCVSVALGACSPLLKADDLTFAQTVPTQGDSGASTTKKDAAEASRDSAEASRGTGASDAKVGSRDAESSDSAMSGPREVLRIASPADQAVFGASVAIVGNTLAVTAPFASVSAEGGVLAHAGATYVYDLAAG